MEGPPLDLGVVVTTPEGSSYRWDANASNPERRPQRIQFGTRLMEGFAAASCTLNRRGQAEYPDLHEYDDVQIVGIDGSSAYEGRIAPRADDWGGEVDQVGVVCGSWMSHARDLPLAPFVYLDTALDRWSDMPAERNASLSTKDVTVVQAQVENGHAQLTFPNQGIGASTRGEAWYTAPRGAKVQTLLYTCNVANWAFGAYVGIEWRDDPGAGASQVSARNFNNTPQSSAATAAYKFISMGFDANGTAATPWVGQMMDFYNLGVLGPHNLALVNNKLRASDIIKHSAALVAPLLDTSGLTDTGFSVAHAVVEEPMDAYDLWVNLNRYDLRNLAVWENHRMTNEPLGDAEEADARWRVRTDEPGVRVRWAARAQGINGVRVTFQNVATNRAEIRTPADDARLLDADPSLACNRRGIKVWATLSMPDPTTPELAIQYAARALALYNQQQQPAKLTITGHVRLPDGTKTQAWRVRAGQYVLIEDDIGVPRPRLITETVYDHDTRTLTATLDGQSQDLDAVMQRVLVRGLSSV